MVEADYKINMHAHVAGLKRLSARANAGPTPVSRKVSFLLSSYGSNVIEHLRKCRVHIDRGLSEPEFERLEALYHFSFPPDLRAIFAEGLPIGAGFPDWRSGGPQQLKMWINKPKSGIINQVEMGTFWLKQWGSRPLDVDQALRIARRKLQKAPVLIPLCGNCYVAASPCRAGNPVFFVDGGDVFCCGLDASDFFHRDSFSTSSRRSGSGFVPEPIFFGEGAKCNKLSTKSEFLSFYEEEQDRSKSTNVDNWSRNLDALARPCCGERKSSDSARSVLSARSSSGSDYSLSSPSPDHRQRHHHHCRETSSIAESRTARRIDFWSDLSEKGNSLNSDSLSYYDETEAEFIEFESESEVASASGSSPSPSSTHSRTRVQHIPSTSTYCSNSSSMMKETVDDMASRLRRGGWNEADIAEIAESATSPACSSDYPNGLPDRQTVLEGLAFHLDCLSSSLRKAGWSVHDVAESMCLDFETHKKKRAGVKVSPEAAARLGMLAAFVAQG